MRREREALRHSLVAQLVDFLEDGGVVWSSDALERRPHRARSHRWTATITAAEGNRSYEVCSKLTKEEEEEEEKQ